LERKGALSGEGREAAVKQRKRNGKEKEGKGTVHGYKRRGIRLEEKEGTHVMPVYIIMHPRKHPER